LGLASFSSLLGRLLGSPLGVPLSTRGRRCPIPLSTEAANPSLCLSQHAPRLLLEGFGHRLGLNVLRTVHCVQGRREHFGLVWLAGWSLGLGSPPGLVLRNQLAKALFHLGGHARHLGGREFLTFAHNQ
jgi:hypothetical protein